MNILYLATHSNIGGITSYLLMLSKGMIQKGHAVHLASSGGELAAEFNKLGVSIIPIPIRTKSIVSPKIFMSLLQLRAYVKRNRIDLIHANTRVTQVLACTLARVCGVPYVSTCHGFFKTKFLRKALPCWGARVIAISESVQAHLIDDFQVAPAQVRLVYSGIDIEKFSAQRSVNSASVRKTLGLTEGFVIGIIARLSDVKGHAYLIEAMREVVAQFPRAQLLIVGEGRMRNELVRLVKTAGLIDRVVFLSQVDDIADTLAALDVFVMPSLKEGLGLGLMEAMAAQVAVVGSAVGGIKNLIRGGYNGLLVEPANVSQLASAICSLLKDEGKRRDMGIHARDFIRQHFSFQKMIDETEGVYRECLSAA